MLKGRATYIFIDGGYLRRRHAEILTPWFDCVPKIDFTLAIQKFEKMACQGTGLPAVEGEAEALLPSPRTHRPAVAILCRHCSLPSVLMHSRTKSLPLELVKKMRSPQRIGVDREARTPFRDFLQRPFGASREAHLRRHASTHASRHGGRRHHSWAGDRR